MQHLARLAGKRGCCWRGQCIHHQAAKIVGERLLLARLAADEPQFFNPLEAMAAESLRDAVLAEAAGGDE